MEPQVKIGLPGSSLDVSLRECNNDQSELALVEIEKFLSGCPLPTEREVLPVTLEI